MRGPLRRLALGACVCAAVSACAAAQEANPLASSELTIERERELTAGVARQIREQLPLLNDPVLLAYLNELGQQIVATTEPQPFIYRFALIEDEALNAFTIGGGYVYLHSGVLAQAGDVSELMGVLAHEVAHVRQRHIARRSEGQGVATLITLATLAAVALGGGDPGIIAIGQGVNVALQLKNSRTAEADADREAIRYLVKAGYDPSGMRRFFQRLIAEHGKGPDVPAYLYSHPAVKERVAAVRVEIERSEVPRGLRRNDPDLERMQLRLARLLEPVAGGSGLLAQPEFDRTLTDPLLEEARAEHDAGRGDAADLLLARARELEPNDPRVALLAATWAEDREDWEGAHDQLERAFDLDPRAPLVQYRLGVANARLGRRTRAAFYLEQAAAGFRIGSAGRKRAELELSRLSVAALEESGLRGDATDATATHFRRGKPIVWWGRLSEEFMLQNPEVRVRWIGPDGLVAHEETLLMSPLGRLSSRLDTGDATPGAWRVEVTTGDTPVDRREFELLADHG